MGGDGQGVPGSEGGGKRWGQDRVGREEARETEVKLKCSWGGKLEIARDGRRTEEQVWGDLRSKGGRHEDGGAQEEQRGS